MAESEERVRTVYWRLPLLIVITAFLTAVVLEIADANLGGLVSLLIVTPACVLVLLVIFYLTVRRRDWKGCLCLVVILAGYVGCYWALLMHSSELRAEARWIGRSKELKAEVLALPQPTGNDLRHIEWEDFGALGTHTLVYLVYSPDDGLRYYGPTHLSGLPCEVWNVHRLEKQWYAVKFYSDSVWPGGRFPSKACQ